MKMEDFPNQSQISVNQSFGGTHLSELYADEEEFNPALLLEKYYTPGLCLFGGLGNFLSLALFCTDPKYKSQSSPYYLSALAASDTCFLLSAFAVWYETFFGGLITFDIICPMVMYLGQVTTFTSTYLTVAFSIERYVAVHFPLARPTICTRSKAKNIVAGITLTAAVLFSYVLIIAKVMALKENRTETELTEVPENKTNELPPEVSSDTNETEDWWNQVDMGNATENGSDMIPEKIFVCTVPAKYYNISEIANYIDSLLTLVIPFFLVAILNFKIARTLCKAMDERQEIMALEQVALPKRKEGKRVSTKLGKQNSVVRSSPASTSSSIRIAVQRERQTTSSSERRVTKILLLVSLVFLLLNLPAHAIRCAQFVQVLTGTEKGKKFLLKLQPWANMLFNTSFAVNFLLYCVSGQSFRHSLRILVLRKSRSGDWMERVEPRSSVQAQRLPIEVG